MKRIEDGNFVKICYTGKFENGDVFDKTDECESIEIHIGAGDVIPGLEKALIGMGVNEKKTIELGPDEAYGDRDERLQRVITRSDFPPDFQPQVGEVVGFRTPAGEMLPAVVKETNGETVTIDFNHPLAGRSLVFEVEVAEINEEAGGAVEGATCESGCCCS